MHAIACLYLYMYFSPQAMPDDFICKWPIRYPCAMHNHGRWVFSRRKRAGIISSKPWAIFFKNLPPGDLNLNKLGNCISEPPTQKQAATAAVSNCFISESKYIIHLVWLAVERWGNKQLVWQLTPCIPDTEEMSSITSWQSSFCSVKAGVPHTQYKEDCSFPSSRQLQGKADKDDLL